MPNPQCRTQHSHSVLMVVPADLVYFVHQRSSLKLAGFSELEAFQFLIRRAFGERSDSLFRPGSTAIPKVVGNVLQAGRFRPSERSLSLIRRIAPFNYVAQSGLHVRSLAHSWFPVSRERVRPASLLMGNRWRMFAIQEIRHIDAVPSYSDRVPERYSRFLQQRIVSSMAILHIFHDYYDYIEFQLRCEYNEIPIIRLDTQFSCNRRIQYESCLVLPFSSL